jgi:hypothetical protein
MERGKETFMGRAVKVEDRLACDGCGHSAALHSNEACEAIRCSCRVTRKALAKRPAVGRSPEPVSEPAVKRKRKRSRVDRTEVQPGDTQAA